MVILNELIEKNYLNGNGPYMNKDIIYAICMYTRDKAFLVFDAPGDLYSQVFDLCWTASLEIEANKLFEDGFFDEIWLDFFASDEQKEEFFNEG